MLFHKTAQIVSMLASSTPVRALFVKRWGTLLSLPPSGRSLGFQVELLMPGAVDALFRAKQAGWRLYLIGNEDEVAQGRVSDEEWNAFEEDLMEHLRSQGAGVQRCYACLDDPERGKGRHRRRSVFRLPDTGVFYHASQHDEVSLLDSWVIGDSTLDLAAGERAGCRVAGVRTGLALGDGELEVDPQMVGADLAEVADALSSALRRRAG